MLKKITLGIKSIIFFLLTKIKYGNNVSVKLINSIKGKLQVELDKSSNLAIGNFLMTTGPCYIKCGQSAKLSIGNRCFMNHNVSITANENITIGDDVNIANNVVIVDHDHIMTSSGCLGQIVSSPVSIGNKVWIGANVTITKGISIGDGAAIAANAAVVCDVPPHELWGGVPAKRIKILEDCEK